ncbi:hypothetical protein SELMODRAFT_91894, partial [Selaginella moellendorffii]
SDMYSFGVLLMEVVTGRDPVDYSWPPSEVCTYKIHFDACMTLDCLLTTG